MNAAELQIAGRGRACVVGRDDEAAQCIDIPLQGEGTVLS